MIFDRKDIDPKYKWDLTVIYKTVDDFNEDYKKCENSIKAFSAYEKTMTDSAEKLLSALIDMTDIELLIHKLWQYSSLSFAVDNSNNAYQALNSRVRNLAVAADNATWFVTPKILKMDYTIVEKWFDELPALKPFKRKIEKIMRAKPHTLSDKEEIILSSMGNCLDSHQGIRSMFTNADLRFGKIRDAEGKQVEISDSTYVTYLMSSERRVRQSAFRCVYKTYEQFGNTFATIYDAKLREETTLAKIRNYKNSITASTYRDEVTPEIYNNLIKSVKDGLAPLYEYYDLKRDILGLEKLHLYDVYTPLIGELNVKYTYEQAVEEVIKACEPLGEEYVSILAEGLTKKGWVDVYPSRGKRGGAFSSSTPLTEPYILMNFNDTYSDVSTLAHEAGHSMHSWYSTHYNEHFNSNYTIFVAEVASTVNELLLSHRKLRECKSDDEKLYILNQIMETYKGTLYRQTMFAEFERDMHALCEKGVPLTAEVLNKNYYKLVKKYFGPKVACDRQIEYEWMRIPHFYSCFYVYKYATCISAATAIVKRIENEGEEYVRKYIDFLKCGDSKSPVDSLLVAGIDMTDPAVIKGAVEEFSSAVSQFKEIYLGRK